MVKQDLREVLGGGTDTLAVPGNKGFRQLAEAVEEWERAKADLAAAEDRVSALKAAVQELQRTTIPETMLALNLRAFTTADGQRVEVRDRVAASVPKARFGEAVKWLEAHGYADILKMSIRLDFSRGDKADYAAAREAIRSMGLTPTESHTLHPQTLKAFCRERVQEEARTGRRSLPRDVFGVYEYQEVEVRQ